MSDRKVLKFIDVERKDDVYIVLDKINYWSVNILQEETTTCISTYSNEEVWVEGDQREKLLKYFSLYPPKPVPERFS